MEPEDWDKIKEKYVEIVKDLDVDGVLPHMIQDDIFFIDDAERVRYEKTHNDKARKFLEILKCKHGGYKPFYRALQTVQRYLAELLKQPREDSSESKVDPVQHLRSVFEERGGQNIPFSEIIDELKRCTGKMYLVSDAQMLVEQAFEHVTFPVKKKNKKKTLNQQFVEHLTRRKMTTDSAKGQKPSSHESGTGAEFTKRPDTMELIHQQEIRTLTVDDLYERLKIWAIPNKIDLAFLEVIKDQDIDGSVFCEMTEEDIEKLLPTMSFGHRKKLHIFRKETEMAKNSPNTHYRKKEMLEEFDKALKPTSSYTHQAIVRGKDTEVTNLMEPVHRFVGAQTFQGEDLLSHIASETVRFAAACLNRRTNGTVHFGIDEKGEILGVQVEERLCREKINRLLEDSFFPDQHTIVKSTIRPAKCIEVLQANVVPRLCIVEVDIVPSFCLVGEEAFFLRPPTKSGKKKNSASMQLLVYDGDKLEQLSSDRIIKYMERKKDLSEARNREEIKVQNQRKDKHLPDLGKKLMQLFSAGTDSLEQSDIHRILVCGKPDDKHRNLINVDKFGFLKMIDWTVVLDMDDATQEESLYNLYENTLEKTTAVLTADDFDPRSSENTEDKNRLKQLYDDLTNSQHPPWIFLNGYDPLNKKTLSPKEWKRKRSVGFKEVLRFFHNEIPEGRAIIVVLLLSKDQSILPDVCDEICSTFEDQWITAAEEPALADSLKHELVRRNVDKTVLDDRFVVGIPWQHVNETIRQLKGPILETECLLITSSGAPCVLKEKTKGKLTDLDILSKNQCDGSNMDADTIEKLSKEEEARFYKGDEVSWWNFWFQDHVCRRGQHVDLMNQARRSLEGDLREGDKVGRVHLYHHPGSGGTTSAKQVLWDFRKEYRCCVVKQLTDQTCEQISKLRIYEDGEKPKPVLCLLDNLDEERVDQLYAELEEIGRQSARSPQEFSVFCVLLICYRRTKSDRAYLNKLVWLTHDLPQDELQWFKGKYVALEKKHREKKGVDPTTLIAFNILKENFNPEYIKRAVQKFLDDVTDRRERNLLKYISLINTYDIDFQVVPLSSFDPMMLANQHLRQVACQGRWETQLSSSVKVLLNHKPRHSKGLRVFSVLISKEILHLLINPSNGEAQAISSAMLEFLHSSVLKSNDSSNRQIWKLVRNLMKKRSWIKPGMKEKFSPLISEVCEIEGIDEAAEVMITVFERTDDPMVAQSIARLYIQAENWDKADIFARACTNMRPNNSCVWDTYGQVYKSKLEAKYNSYIKDPSKSTRAPTDTDLRAIDDAITGIEIFRKEQRVSQCETTMSVSNKAGFFGELQITILLLDLLCLWEPFQDQFTLKNFMINQAFVPPQVQALLGPQRCERLKLLYKDSYNALMSLEDEFLHLKDGTVDDYRRSMHKINKSRLIKLKEYHDTHFGEGEDRVPENLSCEDAAEFRRRRVIRLGGLSLGRILDIRDQSAGERTLLQMYDLLLQNTRSTAPQPFDFKCIIGASLALSTFNLSQTPFTVSDLIRWSRTLYGRIKDDDDRIELEAYLYMVMFNWPTEDSLDSLRCSSGTLQTAVKRWKQAFYAKYPKQKEGAPIKRKETTIYHLGKGTGLDQYTHFEQLHGRQGRRVIRGAQIWTNPETVRRLKVLSGILTNHGNDVQISLRSQEGSISQLTIPSGMPIHDKSLWNKPVYFFLGFSWVGPRAYGITGEYPRVLAAAQCTSQPAVRVQPQMNIDHQQRDVEINIVVLQLRQIAELKAVFSVTRYLPPHQYKLMKNERVLQKTLHDLVSTRNQVFGETQIPYDNFH